MLDENRRKPTKCFSENKDADQQCSKCTLDQRTFVRYTERTISLLIKFPIQSGSVISKIVQSVLWRFKSEIGIVTFLMSILHGNLGKYCRLSIPYGYVEISVRLTFPVNLYLAMSF